MADVPQLRAGMFPWFLTSSEARFLTIALEQLLDVAPRVRDDEDVLCGEEDDEFLVRVPRVEKCPSGVGRQNHASA